tara:strand:+ start:14442 stop:15632 length:1191 start_codon:yes stop_codon:yes gene_type:complete
MVVQDVVVIGAGAAGLMCAATAGQRGLRVTVLDHAKRPGKKILISGGGRCNFTNYEIDPHRYISNNIHFCKSALARYTQWDFIALVEKYKIAYHEKTLGQLFCDDSAKSIVAMLEAECHQGHVQFHFETQIQHIERLDSGHFVITTDKACYRASSLVIASGGLSMPRLGATPFAYKVAEQFGLPVIAPRAGLVPFTLSPDDKAYIAELSGVALPAAVTTERITFDESILLTHRGLSGPAMLQASSYWQAGESIEVNLLPHSSIRELVQAASIQSPQKELKTVLCQWLPKRLVEAFIEQKFIVSKKLNQLIPKDYEALEHWVHRWALVPAGTEGYRTAEVTLGGIDTDFLSSKTMMAKQVKGLYFIGESVDVTGWLGGYNFQWAWSSGWVAGQSVSE